MRETGRQRIITSDDVHDFADDEPDYIERTARFGHTTPPAVAMRLLPSPNTPPRLSATSRRRGSAPVYGEWAGAYPYPNITIVDPAFQSGAGGMEYPTLFTAGTRWIAPRRVAQPESVTVHEAGHQFWYGVVATNEFEHAWMDEGLNTFSTARTLQQFFEPHYYSKRYFGGFIPWVFDDLPISRATDGNRLSPYRPLAKSDSQTRRVALLAASAVITTLAEHVGAVARLGGAQRILSTTMPGKVPTSCAWISSYNEVSGRDLTSSFSMRRI
jgi:aminopeptidase N